MDGFNLVVHHVGPYRPLKINFTVFFILKINLINKNFPLDRHFQRGHEINPTSCKQPFIFLPLLTSSHEINQMVFLVRLNHQAQSKREVPTFPFSLKNEKQVKLQTIKEETRMGSAVIKGKKKKTKLK